MLHPGKWFEEQEGGKDGGESGHIQVLLPLEIKVLKCFLRTEVFKFLK